MIIASSNVSLNSTRSYQRNVSGQTTITKWRNLNPTFISTTTRGFSSSYSEESMYNNYNDFSKNLQVAQKKPVETSSKSDNTPASSIAGITHPSELTSKLDEIMSKTLRSLFELLYRGRGVKYRMNDLPSNHLGDYRQLGGIRPITDARELAMANAAGTLWNQTTDTYYSYEESETTTFSSTGTAITADGRELSFDVTFTMSHAFKEEYQSLDFCQYEQVLTDPLVINLDSNPDYISDQTFFFDIDCDGQKEELSSLNTGVGFLAYDKNNDGVINDGSELFGTKSGNGFYDLLEYDEDGNGWIDEADSIYEHLKVWTKDKDGKDVLLSLKKADVGAIYLGNTKTPFSIKDTKNSLNGVVRNSGIFLKESGESGIISQIDLVQH